MQLYHPLFHPKGNTMNTLRKSILIGLTVVGLGATSFAVQAQDTHPERRQMHAKWGERAAAHQKKLHDMLKLTPSQESAWASYLAATKPAMRGEHEGRGDWSTMAAPERLDKRIAMAKQHIAMMETQLAALNTFYAVLTPEQKKLFDANSMHGGHRGHGMKQRGEHGAAG